MEIFRQPIRTPERSRRPAPRGHALSRLLLPILLHPMIAGCSGSSDIPAECLPPYIQHLAGDISQTAKTAGIPVELAFTIATNEGWVGKNGRDGEVGAFQLMPDTSDLMCDRLDLDPCDPHDPHTNIQLGIEYLRLLYENYDGDAVLTARAFNGGTGGALSSATDLYEQRFIMNRAHIRACAQHPGQIMHTVQSGESLSTIAQRYGVTVGELAQENNIANPNWVTADTVLIIPDTKSSQTPQEAPQQPQQEAPVTTPEPSQKVSGRPYTIQPGDQLARIANKNGVSLKDLAKANNIGDTDYIQAGDVIIIPDR